MRLIIRNDMACRKIQECKYMRVTRTNSPRTKTIGMPLSFWRLRRSTRASASLSLSLSSPFAGAAFTRTSSLSQRIHPDVPTLLASRNRYRVRRCDIAHAIPIGVAPTPSETHHGGHVTPSLEIRAHYAPM